MVCVSISLYTALFLNEKDKSVSDRTDTISWYCIFAGKILKFICGNLFLRIAGKIAKIAKIRTRINFVPHGD